MELVGKVHNSGGGDRSRFAACLMMGVSWAACLIIPAKVLITPEKRGRTPAGHIFPSDRRNRVRIFVSACLRGLLDVGGRMPSVGTGLSLDTWRVCAALVPASRLPGLLVGLLRNLISVSARKGLGWLNSPGPRLAHDPPTRSRPFCQPSPAKCRV
jgi:hypothetical protein